MSVTFTLKDSARIALAVAAAFPLASHAVPAGRVDFVIGSASALGSDGRSRTLTKGSEFDSGETITTTDGRVQLRFTDGSQVSLQPGTQYRVDNYEFHGSNDGKEKGFFSLLKGGFRTITGLIGKADRQAYKVSTSTATIGIRGTEYFLREDKDGVTISTGEGLVEVCTAAGCIVLAAGESAVVADANGLPVRVFNLGGDSTLERPDTPSVKIDYARTDEGLTSSMTTQPSGSGYAMAAAGFVTQSDYGEHSYNYIAQYPQGTASFAGNELISFDGAEGGNCYSYDTPCNYTAKVLAGGLTDGVVGWGRWASNSYSDYYVNEQDIAAHYVVGKPTSSADMDALYTNSVVGYYTLSGYTLPTATNSSTHVTTVGSSGMTGSLWAYFGSGSVSFNLNNINVAGQSYGLYGTGTVYNSDASIWGSGTATSLSNCCGSSATVSGFFFGSNAARAGLVYQFTDTINSNEHVISGAAVFKPAPTLPPS